MATQFKKGDRVQYDMPRLGGVVTGVVRRAHKDGTCTVQAFFVLDADSKPSGFFLGHTYRYDAGTLAPRAA